MNKSREIRPAVAAAIFNEGGKMLLQKRRDVNSWCLISGHVEFGETVEEAIIREVKEETNTTATIIRLIGIYSSPASQTYDYKNKTVQYVTSYFEVKLTDTLPPGFSNEETQELKFFSPERLPHNLALMNANWLTDALSRDKTVFVR